MHLPYPAGLRYTPGATLIVSFFEQFTDCAVLLEMVREAEAWTLFRTRPYRKRENCLGIGERRGSASWQLTDHELAKRSQKTRCSVAGGFAVVAALILAA